MNTKQAITSISFTLLAACGGSEPGSSSGALLAPQIDLSGSFDYFGLLDVEEDTFEEVVRIDAGFQRFTDTQQASIFINSIPQVADTCSGRVTETIPTDVGVIGLPEAQFTFVSAGAELKLQKAGVDFVEIPFEGSGTFRGNGTDLAPYPVDADLMLQVPGDVFPAFADVAMPDPNPVQGFMPNRNDSIEATTRFTWTPGSGHDGTIFFTVIGISPDSQWVEFKCRPNDDGEFELTNELKAMLDSALPADWTLKGLDVRTETVTVVAANNALLVATRRVN